MTAPRDLVFLLDVDNTLLNNDEVITDLQDHLTRHLGAANANRYWAIFEGLRSELGYADYLGALQRYRLDAEAAQHEDPCLLGMSSFLIDYPFADRLYAGALAVIERLDNFGPTVILSDGDVVFQPRKVQRSGLWDAVSGRALIYIHKEQMLDAVQRHYRARHYVMVDDKLRVLATMKGVMQNRLTTVFPRQGHYALDPVTIGSYPAADFSVDRIADLLDVDMAALIASQEKR